jgi:hypothetical protein
MYVIIISGDETEVTERNVAVGLHYSIKGNMTMVPGKKVQTFRSAGLVIHLADRTTPIHTWYDQRGMAIL